MNQTNCKYQLLHETAFGAVSCCTNCETIKVTIGPLMSLISREAFTLILEDFIDRHAFYFEEGNLPERILICLNNNNLFLNLSPSEFEQLLDLFRVSNHMLTVHHLINAS